MKKIFVAILAMVAMAACATDDVVRQNYDNAIEFNTFVGNSTKVAIDNSYSNTTGNLEQFQVWGTIAMTGTENYANIFDGVVVNKGGSGVGSAWTYGVEYTQYWIPGNTYSFVGIVDGNEGNNSVVEGAYNMPTHINVDMAQQSDVLYATAGKAYVQGGAIETVHLQFAHLLAKAKFTVKNTMTVASGYSYTVEDIRIVNADAAGQYDIQAKAWTPATGVYTADFGKVTADHETVKDLGFGAKEESDLELLLLPHAGKKLAIEVDYTLYRSGVMIQQFVGATTKQVSATLDIVKGNAYNFVLELGNPGEAITFDAEVEDWIPEGGQDTPVYSGQTVYVASAQELNDALTNPEVSAVVLTEDVELTGTISRAGGDSYAAIDKSFVIDGQGHTLTYKGSNRAIDITNKAENSTLAVTIKNLTLNCTASYLERGINYNAGGTLTLENVNFEGTAPTYAVNLPGSADNAVVTIKNSHIVGNIALNVWGENAKIDVIDSYLSNYDNTEVENYVTVKLNNDGSTSAEGTVINIKGGKVVAYDQNGDPCYATGNATAYGQINISETTEVVGNVFRQVAVVTYENSNCFYGVGTLAGAIAKCIKTNGASVRLTSDIVLEEPLTIKAGESVVLDLCGHTVSAVDTTDGTFCLILNNGTLTINDTKGNGALKVESTNDRGWGARSAVVSNEPWGVLVVNGGTLEHLGGTSMAYAIDNLTGSDAASCTINGGHIKSTYRAIRQFLNSSSHNNSLIVNGGVIEGANKSIWMQDANKNANPATLTVAAEAQLKGDVYLSVTAGSTAWPVEVSIASAALVGESTVLTSSVPVEYQVVEENGVWTVIKNTVAATTADLQTALDEGKDVVLANNLTITPEEMSTAPYGNKMALSQKGGVFNGNGKAISVTADGDNYVLMTNGGTIKNLDINRGFRGVVLMNPTQDVYVDNVKVGVNDEVCYTINTAEGDGTHSLYVSNSVLNGWCSIGTAVKDVTFTNCTFGQGTYYTNVYGRLVKPYVDAVFDGCDFCNKCYLDLSAFVGTKVIVKNCTVNGVKITAENWASLVAPEATCKDGQISVELKNGSYLTAENIVDYIVFE